MKLTKYLPYGLLAVVIVIFKAREMFHSKCKHNMNEALKLQSEQNRLNTNVRQIPPTKTIGRATVYPPFSKSRFSWVH